MPRTPELTPRQRETLEWIKGFIRENGMPPTVREIGDAFGIKSSSVFELLKALERKGYVRRGELGARSLIVEGQAEGHECNWEEIPVVGRIAAGHPIEALEHDHGHVAVWKNLLGDQGGYALRVDGSSMIEAGILDGDYVIVRKQETAGEGDIVVALIENEATLKRFYWERDRVRLDAANEGMQPIFVRSGELRIQGKVVAVHRML